MNFYRFDNGVLGELIGWTQDERCTLERIKFLYYDYSGSLNDHRHFYDPDLLDKEKLERMKRLNWKVTYPKHRDGRNGFVIKLKRGSCH